MSQAAGGYEPDVEAAPGNRPGDLFDLLAQQRQVGDEVKGFVFTAHAGAVDEVGAKRFYRQRHKIENFFCRVKHWRRIATRYDKLARKFLPIP